MVESLYNFLESVIGTDLVKKTFWFFATIFIFILFLNWFGLIPGVGTIGACPDSDCGFVDAPHAASEELPVPSRGGSGLTGHAGRTRAVEVTVEARRGGLALLH